MTRDEQEDATVVPDHAETTDTAVEPDEQTTEQADSGDEQRPDVTRSGEAAKWRRRLRDTEAERDDLASRLDTMQRREVARLATTPGRDQDGHPVPTLYDASDVFADDADLADLLDDDGALDEQRIRAAIEASTEGRTHVRSDLAPRPPKASPAQGSSANPAGRQQPGAAWQRLLQGGR